MNVVEDVGGYTIPELRRLTGFSPRQLDCWARTAFIVPSLRPARGSGYGARLYTEEDLQDLLRVKALLDAGVSLQSIRLAFEGLQGGRQGLARRLREAAATLEDTP